MIDFLRVFVGILLLFLLPAEAGAAASQAMGYTPKYPDGFEHFDYVNPEAPRGGSLALPAFGSFDTLNPFTLKGIEASGVESLIFETLMVGSLDEPFSQYGLLADDVKLAKDKLSVTYHINPAARFNDGSPVTSNDVVFSYKTLRDKGHPKYRIYWSDIKGADTLDKLTVRFNFKRINPELHLIIGQMPVFSRNWVGNKAFDKMALEMPIGSGPYLIEKYELGKYITYKRNPDYWGWKLNVRRGMFNFDRITFKYYFDFTVMLEAFKAGEFDFNHEYNSKTWARGYIGPKFRSGQILKKELPHRNDAGMQGFIFNLRNPLFQDIRVRQALSQALDFEWSNRNLFYNQYQRNDSYFSNSELAAIGKPSVAELKLLAPYRDKLPPELFEKPWQPPSTKPPGSLRANLRKARELLKQAGWVYRDGALRNSKGKPFSFSIVLVQKGFERIVAPFARNLQKLGIDVKYRTIDRALYQRRMDKFDFDMTVSGFGQSQSPGNEQINMFHSSSANQEGSMNLMGIADPVVDAMVENVVYARDRKQLVTACHALDRVLLYGSYLIPHWYIGTHRVAWWDRFAMPNTLPFYYDPTSWTMATWWLKPEEHK